MRAKTNTAPKLWPYSIGVSVLIATHLIIKHWLVGLDVTPVRTDPCDAVNLFAFVTIALVLVASLLRKRFHPELSAALRYLYAFRSHQAILFAILMALLAEIITLGRHLHIWSGTVSPIRLLALLAFLSAVSLAMQLRLLFTYRNRISMRPTRAVFPALLAVVVLLVCPEWPISNPSTAAHILTVAAGAIVVLIPTRLLLHEVVVHGSDVRRDTITSASACEWTLILIGVGVALFGFSPYASNLAGPLGHIHIPILLFEIADLLIAYSILAPPLGVAITQRD